MDYTSASNYITDAQGRRQYADRDIANGVPGTSIVAVDLNAVQNTIIEAFKAFGIVPVAGDDTLLTQAISAAVLQEGKRAKAAEATLISGTTGVVSDNGDAQGTALKLSGSSGNANFAYTGGNFDLAKYASYVGAPVLYGSSASITVPAGVTRAFIKIIGGAGSGCSCKGTSLQTSTYGAGGGAGGYLYFWIAVKAGDIIGLTIGAGATSPTQTVSGQTNGGQTSVTLNGTQVAWAGGGTGGVWNSVSSCAGGTGGGASTLSGANPIEYSNGSSGGDGQTGAQSISSVTGYGGAGPWGGGGRAGNGGGTAGTGFGAGGGGAYDTSGSNNFYSGGAGHGGCATVELR